MKSIKYFSKIILLISITFVSCSKEELNEYQVDVSSNEGGIIEGIINSRYIEGENITLTANPNSEKYKSYIFEGWSGTISSTENPLNVIVTSNMSITANFRLRTLREDEIYSTIDIKDPKSFIKAFIEDAKRYGLDLSYVDIDNSLFTIGDIRGIAYSQGACDPTTATISINTSLWNHNDLDHPSGRIYQWLLGVIWHELGHDLLQLNHLCAGGHFMSGRHQSPRGDCGEEPYKDLYSLKYNNDDLYINWQRAAEDMFTINNQSRNDCYNKQNNITGKSTIIID